MKKFTFTFNGRMAGAIGKFYPCKFVTIAPNLEAATTVLYFNYEHITNLKTIVSGAKFSHFYLCDYSNTVRVYPENHWIATIKENRPFFDSWDGAIIGRFTKVDIDRLFRAIHLTRCEHSNLCKVIDGRTAVIVKTGKSYGVQYWMDYQINNKRANNTDGSKSYFITKL